MRYKAKGNQFWIGLKLNGHHMLNGDGPFALWTQPMFTSINSMCMFLKFDFILV